MSLLSDTIRRVRLEKGRQSIAPSFQSEEPSLKEKIQTIAMPSEQIQTRLPDEGIISPIQLREKIREVRNPEIIKAREKTLKEKLFEKIPAIIREPIFGTRQQFEKGGKFQVDKGFLGFAFPGFTKTDEEKVFERISKLKEKGVEEKRASEIAMTDVLIDGVTGMLKKQEGLKRLNLSEDEKKTLRNIGIFEKLELALDFVVLPVGRIKNISKIKNSVDRSVLKSFTFQDLVDITAGRQVSPEKLSLFKTITADPALKKELLNLQRNKKIPLKQKIGSFIDDIFKRFEKAVPETEPKQLRSAIRKVRGEAPVKRAITPTDNITTQAKTMSKEEFVKAQGTPKTVSVWIKSKFFNDGAYVDIPVIRKEENITLYQGAKMGENRQFWSPDKKYAETFGDVKEKTGTFYKIDNGNRVTDVYVEAPTKSQLTDIWEGANKAVGGAIDIAKKVEVPLQTRLEKLRKAQKEVLGKKIHKMVRSKEIPSLEATAQKELQLQLKQKAITQIDAGNKEFQKTLSDVVSYNKDIAQETKINKSVEKKIIKKDTTGTVGDVATPPKETPEDLITTRKFKQTDEWKDFAKYAEEHLQDKDIYPAVAFRHITMPMERVAEFLDGGIGGRTYKTIVKPVYDSAEKMQLEGAKIKEEFDSFRVLEGSGIDKDASLFAQKKLDDASQKSQEVAKYVRDKYDEFLKRLNIVRAKVGVEDIPKRRDYITHLNELNVLSEFFGGMERITVKRLISQKKSEILDAHPDWTDARAFDRAKREVEGLTGVAQYVDARQPIFKFAKRRLGEYEANPSIVRSFNTYSQNALRYIYQAENVARNKAFKDVLPANAREFTRLWNTEQVAGRQAPSFLSPVARRVLSALRGTLGANTILGNMATVMMQLTSWAQVVALAGVKNTFYGLGSRLRTYIPGLTNQFDVSRTRHLRNLNIDIGLGDSLIDKALINIGKYEVLRNPAARTRQAIDVGRNFLMAIMETADQFTVGATYQAFYRKGLLDGLEPQEALEFAEIMTGKTQANYFKEALPPFLNTIEGKTLGQFGTYGMNQWEMFRRDFGKDFKLDEKNPKSVARFFKQFIVFLVSAYIIDSMSEETFGRQPYDVKELIDDSIGFAKGELTGGQLRDTSKETVMTYIPFMGSVKFDSMPPVLEFGNTVKNSIFASGKKQEDAINDLEEKWIYNILLPYGGNQMRKSLQGIEASTEVDLPFVRNVSKNIDIKTNIDKAKAILFGPYATEEAIEFFKNRERREGIKEKLDITGTITSDENIAKLKKMTNEEFKIYTAQYAESTLETINNKMGRKTTTTQSRLQRLRKLQELRSR